MKNKSGIYPCGNRVLVKPDAIEETTDGGIYIPPSVTDRHQVSVCYGVVIETGPDAFRHSTEEVWTEGNGVVSIIERRIKGYEKPFAKAGDRIAFAIYAGLLQTGKDGVEYKIINDEDITCKVDAGVTQTSIEGRIGFKAEGL